MSRNVFQVTDTFHVAVIWITRLREQIGGSYVTETFDFVLYESFMLNMYG